MSSWKALSPLRIIRIQVFQSDKVQKNIIIDKIIKHLKQKYENVEKIDDKIRVSNDEAIYRFSLETLDKFLVLKSTIKYNRNYELNVINEGLQSVDLSELISSSKSENLTSFTIFIPKTKEKDAMALLEKYSNHFSKSKLGLGIARGCMLSIFESGTKREELFNKYYWLSPCYLPSKLVEKRLEEILGDIKRLAIYTAELSQLYNKCKPFFSVLESGEMEISEKTEDFLWKLVEPEPVELSTLESWLGYIMDRDSTISAMISTMKVNYAESKSVISKVENLFNKLNEKSFEDYPLNSKLEIESYNKAIQPIENIVIRGEALKARLGTVMEEVRTYLSLQQQKAALEEQKSSKDQLIRIGNLQEILHKLEILIVAFYLTEMARMVFETLLHESANILTIIFIPIALLISVIIIRTLHKSL